MSEQHTPGPWSVKWRTSFGGETYFDGVVGPDGRSILVEGLTLTGGPLAQANSILIAAAPELLAALRDACGWLESVPLGDEPKLVLNRYRALISKATGATS